MTKDFDADAAPGTGAEVKRPDEIALAELARERAKQELAGIGRSLIVAAESGDEKAVRGIIARAGVLEWNVVLTATRHAVVLIRATLADPGSGRQSGLDPSALLAHVVETRGLFESKLAHQYLCQLRQAQLALEVDRLLTETEAEGRLEALREGQGARARLDGLDD